VIFLGQPREATLADAHDANLLERIGLGWLACACIALGVLPVQVISLLDATGSELLGVSLGQHATEWWLLAPTPTGAASYGPFAFLVVAALIIAATIYSVSRLYHRRVRRGPAWDCGFARLDSRMQDTAEGFGQPIRHIFQGFFVVDRELPAPLDLAPRYRVTVSDRIWRGAYEPLGALVSRVAELVAGLQRGRIATYLLFSFVTLLVLLALVL